MARNEYLHRAAKMSALYRNELSINNFSNGLHEPELIRLVLAVKSVAKNGALKRQFGGVLHNYPITFMRRHRDGAATHSANKPWQKYAPSIVRRPTSPSGNNGGDDWWRLQIVTKAIREYALQSGN